MTHRTLTALAVWASLVLLSAPSTAACRSDVHVPQALLERKLVVVGELHGTVETAEFAGEHVCRLVSDGKDVVLALEIPETEQARISTYLGSQGELADVRGLLQGEFWRRPENRQDGRSSEAMLSLIDRMRQLRLQTRRVSVIAVDGQRVGLSRDGAMAQAVRDLVEARPATYLVALVGNVHALRERGAFFDKGYESFAFLLSDLQPLTLNVVTKRGTAWVCIEGCGPREITPPAWAIEKAQGLYGGGDATDPRYHATLVLEKAQASPPARAR